jgi:hypothetical protein
VNVAVFHGGAQMAGEVSGVFVIRIDLVANLGGERAGPWIGDARLGELRQTSLAVEKMAWRISEVRSSAVEPRDQSRGSILMIDAP